MSEPVDRVIAKFEYLKRQSDIMTKEIEDNMQPKTIKILDLWKKKQKEGIQREIDSEKKVVVQSDAFTVAYNSAMDRLIEELEGKVDRKYLESYKINWIEDEVCEPKTMKELESIDEKRIKLLRTLDNTYDEILIMLSGCKGVDDEWDILKSYGVVNHCKRLMISEYKENWREML